MKPVKKYWHPARAEPVEAYERKCDLALIDHIKKLGH